MQDLLMGSVNSFMSITPRSFRYDYYLFSNNLKKNGEFLVVTGSFF